MMSCGYCCGSGQVANSQRDAYGPRPDYPTMRTCEYCGGSGRCDDGDKLLPQNRSAVYQADDDDRRRAGLPSWA